MEVRIEKLDNYGRGITYVNDKICFVENALPNEVVKISIQREHKKYLEATVTEYIEKSFIRIEEECPYSNICGGCQLNHICYNEENKFKRDKIKDIMKKFASIDSQKIDSIIYQDRNHYRNKILLHGDKEKLGLYQKETNEIIPIQECILVNKKINEIIKYLSHINNGIEEVIIKTSNDSSKIMVSITGSILEENELLNMCDVLILNGEYLTEEHAIITTVGKKKYYEGIQSFFQVNNTLTKLLYDEVLNEVKENAYQNVLDLYCGTGTIGIYISDYVNKIIGIDNNPSNINDAIKNKELNQVENIDFICDNVENKINEFKDIDLVIVDPPRAGLDDYTRQILKNIKPKEIIYVSCDPITLARDINELQEEYEIKYIKPFNMFPRTYHVETVSVLTRRN